MRPRLKAKNKNKNLFRVQVVDPLAQALSSNLSAAKTNKQTNGELITLKVIQAEMSKPISQVPSSELIYIIIREINRYCDDSWHLFKVIDRLFISGKGV